MVNREDLFIKAILAAAMSRAGKADTEVEVVPSGGARRIDVYSEPAPDLAAELSDMGMLGELGGVPTCFEAFSDTPGVREMRAIFLKQNLSSTSSCATPASRPGSPPTRRRPAPAGGVPRGGRPELRQAEDRPGDLRVRAPASRALRAGPRVRLAHRRALGVAPHPGDRADAAREQEDAARRRRRDPAAAARGVGEENRRADSGTV